MHEAEKSDPAFGAGGRKLIFEVSTLADKAFWYYFLGSVFAEGLLNWTSQVLNESRCPGSVSTHIAVSHQPYGVVSTLDYRYNAFDWINEVPGSIFGPAFGPSIQIGSGNTGTVICSALATDDGHSPVGVDLQMRWIDNDQVIANQPAEQTPSGRWKQNVIMQRMYNGSAYPRTMGVCGKATEPSRTNELPPLDGYCCVFQQRGYRGNPTT
jgi:hypothetical protein